LLLIDTARLTGLRRSELANLKVRDLDFAAELEEFCQGKGPDESVFGLKAVTISGKISYWAKKAGCPPIHIHSLRHHFATELDRKRVSARVIQQLLGHANLGVTQRYVDVAARDLMEAVNLLEERALSDDLEGDKTPGEPPPGIQLAGEISDDREVGPHQRELFHFGQRLRDRLNLPMPEEVAGAAARGDHLALWSRRSASDMPRDSEEERLEHEWGFDRCDAKRHSLFPAFEQHLAGHACWEALLATMFLGHAKGHTMQNLLVRARIDPSRATIFSC
jgi:hypothetical protein